MACVGLYSKYQKDGMLTPWSATSHGTSLAKGSRDEHKERANGEFRDAFFFSMLGDDRKKEILEYRVKLRIEVVAEKDEWDRGG